MTNERHLFLNEKNNYFLFHFILMRTFSRSCEIEQMYLIFFLGSDPEAIRNEF